MSDTNRKVLEVEGGFIAKEYNEAGDVVAQSAVCATAEEAEAAELVDLVREPAEDEGAGAAPAEEKKDETLPSDQAGASEGAAPTQEGAGAPAAEAAGDQVAPDASTAAPEAGNQDGAKG